MGKSKDLATLTNGGNIAGNFTVDTDTLHIDSTNDRIGFGTTSPSSFSGYNNISVKGGSNGSNFDFQNSSGTRVASIVSAPSTQLIVETLEDADVRIKTNNVERLIVDGSGRVTMPYQPFVRLDLTSHVYPNTSVSYSGNQVTGFTVRENVGSHWNSSNNNFTCPVAGVYTVSVFFIKFPVTGHAHVDLHKNGSQVTGNCIRWRAPEINAGYHQAGGTASVTCAANDVLDWHYFGDAGIHNTNGAWQIMLSH